MPVYTAYKNVDQAHEAWLRGEQPGNIKPFVCNCCSSPDVVKTYDFIDVHSWFVCSKHADAWDKDCVNNPRVHMRWLVRPPTAVTISCQVRR